MPCTTLKQISGQTDQFEQSYFNSARAYEYAAYSGNLAILEHLIEEKYEIPRGVCELVALYGVVQSEEKPWEIGSVVTFEENENDLKVIEYLLDHGDSIYSTNCIDLYDSWGYSSAWDQVQEGSLQSQKLIDLITSYHSDS